MTRAATWVPTVNAMTVPAVVARKLPDASAALVTATRPKAPGTRSQVGRTEHDDGRVGGAAGLEDAGRDEDDGGGDARAHDRPRPRPCQREHRERHDERGDDHGDQTPRRGEEQADAEAHRDGGGPGEQPRVDGAPRAGRRTGAGARDDRPAHVPSGQPDAGDDPRGEQRPHDEPGDEPPATRDEIAAGEFEDGVGHGGAGDEDDDRRAHGEQRHRAEAERCRRPPERQRHREGADERQQAGDGGEPAQHDDGDAHREAEHPVGEHRPPGRAEHDRDAAREEGVARDDGGQAAPARGRADLRGPRTQIRPVEMPPFGGGDELPDPAHLVEGQQIAGRLGQVGAGRTGGLHEDAAGEHADASVAGPRRVQPIAHRGVQDVADVRDGVPRVEHERAESAEPRLGRGLGALRPVQRPISSRSAAAKPAMSSVVVSNEHIHRTSPVASSHT